jgi:hypothetical protein
MNVFRAAMAATLLAAASAQAQLVAPVSQARLQAKPSLVAQAFTKIPAPYERSYMANEGEHPFTSLFEGYRADPRLVAGINLNRYLALETGYRERIDRGFHALDPRDPLDVNGALATRGFHSYAGMKATLPITDSLSAYGKLGVSHSERRGADAVGRTSNVDTGLYTGLGAQYKLNGKAAVSVESQSFGNTSQKWGKDSNGSGVNAKFKLGF